MSRGRYDSLPKSEEETEAFVSPTSPPPGYQAPSKPATKSIPWLSILAWSSTLISALATLMTANLIVSGTPGAAPATGPLKRLTPYTNPERLRQVIADHNATFAPVMNVGASAFSMARGDPKRAITEETSRQRHTTLGDVWPEDRRVFADEHTSTVLQFRHRDFDMEKCVLSVTIPAPAEGFDPAVHIANGSRVDIYQLTPDAEELLPSISWGTAPARHRKLLTVDFDTATNATSRPYHCPRGLFSTFELECVGAPCMVDFWQTRHWKSGVILVQHQTNGHDVADLD